MPREITYNSEAKVKKRIKQLLDKHEWFWWMPPMNGFGKVGVSDFNSLRKSVFLSVEAKYGGNKPTAQQKAYLESIIAEHGIGLVVDEKTLSLFERWLELFDKQTVLMQKREKLSPEEGAEFLDAVKALTDPIYEERK